MFAGKTEELIRRARRALYAKKQVQVFKPVIDNRYDADKVVTHEGVRHEAVVVKSVSEMRKQIDARTEVVLIEEVQFFEPEIVDFVVKLADEGREVVCAGLDQDFRREPFGPMGRLLCVADEVLKLRAVCVVCGQEASHTQRLVDGRPASQDEPIILIGATEQYEARCREHYRIRAKRRSR